MRKEPRPDIWGGAQAVSFPHTLRGEGWLSLCTEPKCRETTIPLAGASAWYTYPVHNIPVPYSLYLVIPCISSSLHLKSVLSLVYNLYYNKRAVCLSVCLSVTQYYNIIYL